MFRIIPLPLDVANMMVKKLHRHHVPVVGHRFSLGLFQDEILHGAVIVGRPVSREIDQYSVAEVTRLVTDGTKNVCSALYAAAARVAREMGFLSIQTYILESEPGISVEAAGWKFIYKTSGGSWSHSVRKNLRREDQPMEPKKLYRKILNKLKPGENWPVLHENKQISAFSAEELGL